MINAPYEKEFVFHDGQRAKNILELSVTLERISQQDFEKFVNTDKNDFANWIEYVLQEKELASLLRSTILLSKTLELINNKLASDNNTNNNFSSNGNSKKSLFNILKQAKISQVVEIKTPVEKLPEPEHRTIQMLPLPEKKRKWFSRKESAKNDLTKIDSTPVLNESPKKDNSLSKWYEFRKHIKKDDTKKEIQNNSANSNYENIFWIIMYGLLVLLIIALVVYAFIFR